MDGCSVIYIPNIPHTPTDLLNGMVFRNAEEETLCMPQEMNKEEENQETHFTEINIKQKAV